MRTIALLGLAVVLALGFIAAPVQAASEVTVSGNVMCAKCTLKKADAKECQDVLVAKDKTEYYIVKNAVLEKFGHTCTGEKAATVTGMVSQKDGKTWIEPSKMEELK